MFTQIKNKWLLACFEYTRTCIFYMYYQNGTRGGGSPTSTSLRVNLWSYIQRVFLQTHRLCNRFTMAIRNLKSFIKKKIGSSIFSHLQKFLITTAKSIKLVAANNKTITFAGVTFGKYYNIIRWTNSIYFSRSLLLVHWEKWIVLIIIPKENSLQQLFGMYLEN